MPDAVIERFFELGKGPNARIVIITTASQLAGTDDIKARFAHWLPRPHKSLTYLHTRSREEADSPYFSECLLDATAVWFGGGNQNLITEAYLGTLVESRLNDLLKRGGVIGGTSAGAAIMTRNMIAGGVGVPVLGEGFGFLKGAIVDQHFAQRNRQGRLMQAIDSRPGQLGIGINECTALVVKGRKIEVVGESQVSICISGTHERPTHVETLATGESEDLIKLSRAAVARTHDGQYFERPHPSLAKGTLVLAGQGPTPQEAVSKFFSAAGGKSGSFVVLSATRENENDADRFFCDWLKDAGAKVHQVRASESRGDRATKLDAALESATGVWIAGSHLGQVVESYLDAPVRKLVSRVLHRGGAIGGTSAGASIHGEFLMDDGSAENKTVIANGYERGLGVLPGVAIGSSFTASAQLGDMPEFKGSFASDFVGLEVPEATALIVSGTKLEVVGRHPVSIYDRAHDNARTQPFVEVVKSGESYDFKQRRRLDGSRFDITQAK